MSLIKFYIPHQHKTLNNDSLCKGCPDCQTIQFRNLQYQTTALTPFDNLSLKELNLLINVQESTAKQMADLYLKHSYLTKLTYEQTIKQYSNFLFLNNHTYKKADVIQYVTNNTNSTETFLDQPLLNSNPQQSNPPQQPEIVQVSKEAIRNITGYSYTIPAYHIDPITKIRAKKKVIGTIEWQKKFIDDDSDIIVLDWCRQWGKSLTVAEKAIEESFITNNDMLVAAFSVSWTRLIRNYILSYIRKFPPGTIDYFKKDDYIINNRTLTKIYFKTLADEWVWVLGLTIKLAIIDEAHLVSTDTFENAIEPTLSANDWRLILMWVAAQNKKCYMYQAMMEIKTNKYATKASYYKISIDDNPITGPSLRWKIEKNKDKPSYMRQYYNYWWDIWDNLITIQNTSSIPDILFYDTHSYLILWIDPARKQDRSGYSLIYVHKWEAKIILSWEVPESHKAEWKLQAKFYLNLIEKITPKPLQDNKPVTHYLEKEQSNKKYNRLYIVIDESWVGDAVTTIFRDAGIPITANIRYTSGMTVSDDWFNMKVSKTILINNLIDLSQEWVLTVFKPTNKQLIEEFEYMEEDTDRLWNVRMKSDFFDDIINATMIASFYAKYRWLIWRSNTVDQSHYEKTWNSVVDAIDSSAFYRDQTQYKRNNNSFW